MPPIPLPFFSIPQVSLLNFVWGMAILLFGYRLFRLFLALSGALLGAQLASRFFPTADPAIHLLIIAVSAVITSVVAYSFYSLTFLFLGAIAGAYAASALASATVPVAFMYVLGALTGAFVGWLLKDLVVVLATAIGGASTLIQSLPALSTILPALVPILQNFPPHLLFIALTIVGLLFQLSRFRPH